jgi:cytochrome c peroxidase
VVRHRERLAEGFNLHRWDPGEADPKSWLVGDRFNALSAFLRKGLVTPPREDRPLTEQEQRGKKVFESEVTQCAQCHAPATELTNRVAQRMPKLPTLPGFEDEEDDAFKTPSLLFVGGTAPYYHDGSSPTFEHLVSRNNDRMGKTNHLSAEDKAALVAYMRTL